MHFDTYYHYEVAVLLRFIYLGFLAVNFFFFFDCVFVGTHGLSLDVVNSGYSLVVVLRLLIAAASLVVEHGLQYLWQRGLVALWFVESCGTRD